MQLDASAEVQTVSSSEQCAKCCQAGFLPTLAMVDHQLPGAKGLEAAKYLLQVNPNVQFLLMTAYARDKGSTGKVYEDYLTAFPGRIRVKEKGRPCEKACPEF